MLKSPLFHRLAPPERSTQVDPAAGVAVSPPDSQLVALGPGGPDAFGVHSRPQEDVPTAALGDAVVGEVVQEVLADPDALGLLLHGSRALGTADGASNYNFICIVTADAWERRRDRQTLLERRFRSGAPTVEIAYESIERLRTGTRLGERRGAELTAAQVIADKTGQIRPLVSAIVAGGQPSLDRVTEAYDSYLNSFAHSLKASSIGDDLGMRAHAAQAALHLVRALFSLEGKPVPYLDQLSVALPQLVSQGWRPGFLHGALLRLFYAPDPPLQQMLERRVSRLMESRGVGHTWREDLDRLRKVDYDQL